MQQVDLETTPKEGYARVSLSMNSSEDPSLALLEFYFEFFFFARKNFILS